MDARKIEILLKVISSGSMMKTSAQVGYTPSGLVQMMNSIENELGIKIIERTNQGVKLTSAGKSLMPLFKEFTALNNRILNEAEKLSKASASTLRIGAYVSIATYWLPSVISEFHETHPDVNIELETLEKPELYDAMLSGRIDLGFASRDDKATCFFIPLKKDEFLAVLPNDVAAKYTDGVYPLDDFNDTPFIMPSLGKDVDVEKIFSSNDIHPQLLAYAAEDSTVINMVAAKIGASMLPELTLSGITGQVVALHTEPTTYRELGIVSVNCDLPPLASEFVEFAASRKSSL